MSIVEDNSRRPYKVLLGVTGCIAAYKSCEILRALQEHGCDVQVVMTESAMEFVGTTTFCALSGHTVGTGLFKDVIDPIPHITLSQNCDLFLIAPCTGNTLAKIAHGIADNLLTSCALACTAPVLVAPAMNVHMYKNDATRKNIESLRSRGYHFVDASYGQLACGEVGEGKLAPVEDIVDAAMKLLEATDNGEDASPEPKKMPLQGKSVLITSGPTVEPIDPVRFISNYSSGKMGAALAKAAIGMGGNVTVISGPVSVSYPTEANIVSIKTADEMLEAVLKRMHDCDVLVFAAAVSDFKPKYPKPEKIKKSNSTPVLSTIEFVENPDILATASAEKEDGQVVVGFAAETNDILSNGRAKLISKAADIIVCNEVGANKALGKDDNSGWIITAASEEELPVMPKYEMAKIILERAVSLLK